MSDSWDAWVEGLAPDVRRAIEEGLRSRRKRRVRCPHCNSIVVVETPDVEGRLKAARALREVVESAGSASGGVTVRRIVIRPDEDPLGV